MIGEYKLLHMRYLDPHDVESSLLTDLDGKKHGWANSFMFRILLFTIGIFMSPPIPLRLRHTCV
jgi:hypothetical protein